MQGRKIEIIFANFGRFIYLTDILPMYFLNTNHNFMFIIFIENNAKKPYQIFQ